MIDEIRRCGSVMACLYKNEDLNIAIRKENMRVMAQRPQQTTAAARPPQQQTTAAARPMQTTAAAAQPTQTPIHAEVHGHTYSDLQILTLCLAFWIMGISQGGPLMKALRRAGRNMFAYTVVARSSDAA